MRTGPRERLYLNYAQTNIQLYAQMRVAGYGESSRARVHEAYILATRLFTAKFRGSGKPLLAHLVGTASVLCALQASEKLLAAAVLHAAYIFGEFGDGRPGMTPSRREVLRQAVDDDVEDLVSRYHQLRWQRGTLETLAQRTVPFSEEECEVLLVRLANELEDHLDLGILYCSNGAARREEMARSLPLCIDIARRIGQPVLAAELSRVSEEVQSAEVPDALRLRQDYTYTLPPASSMPRPGVLIRQVLDRHPRMGLLLHPGKLLSYRRR